MPHEASHEGIRDAGTDTKVQVGPVGPPYERLAVRTVLHGVLGSRRLVGDAEENKRKRRSHDARSRGFDVGVYLDVVLSRQ